MRNLFVVLFSVIFTLIGMVGKATPVFALTVSPVRLEITGDPGSTIQTEIEIFNEQSGEEGEKTFYTSFENFEPSGDSGSPRFIGAKEGLATWIKGPNKVTLDSGIRSNITFSIEIPKDAEPGGHFAAVFFGTGDPSAQGGEQISVGGKIGVLILLRVSGEVAESGGLLNFGVTDNENFFTMLPVSFEYRLNNTGGDRVVPKGEIKIKNFFILNSATLLVNENDGSVLPSSIRKFTTIWGQDLFNSQNNKENSNLGFFDIALKQWKNFHFGWYTAVLDISWGLTNQTANATYNFFVIPWQLLIIVFVILIIVLFLIRIILKKYKQSIITKALEQNQIQQK